MDYVPSLAIGLTIVTAVWSHAIWLSGRFAHIQKDTDANLDLILNKITEKLEYHERHDDRRFGDINNGLWEIRLQNALSGRTGQAKKAQDPNAREGRTSEGV
jgi:hypothetical protein